jgi:hypothetical protein
MSRIPVYFFGARIEWATGARVKELLQAPNATAVIDRKTGQVKRFNLVEFSDDRTMEVHRGNPRRYSFDYETDQNPPRCWTLRYLRRDTAGLYKLSVTDCLKKAA